MSGEPVLLERQGEVALVTLHRPEVRNAVNVALAEALCRAIEEAQSARAIVLTGAPPAFCAGLDLRSLGTESMADLPPFVAAVAGSQTPVIAAVNGPAVTGGLEIALAADFIVASEEALFADTHLRVGVYPGPVLVDLPRRVGPAFAREMSLTGNFVDAATALRVGLANHVVAAAELVPFALSLAAAVAEQDPGMVRAMRQDWEAHDSLPVAQARQAHLDFSRRVASTTTGSGIAQRRETVLERSRTQRRGERS